MASLQDTKRRINSIGTTKKITNAMQLVASAKFSRLKREHDAIAEYQDGVQDIISDLIKKSDDLSFLNKDGDKTLWLVISSTIGLCGGYNSQINKLLKGQLKDGDLIVTVGEKARKYYEARGFEIKEHYTDLSKPVNYVETKLIGDQLLEIFNTDELGISSVKVAYTHFVNAATFEPKISTLLPLKKEETKEKEAYVEIIFEPSVEKAIEATIPLYFNAVIYGLMSHSFTSEEGSRRTAMESATDNADEIQDKLELEYNRKRQAAITQEIAEIVGGANAL